MRISILIMLAGLLVGQGDGRGNLFVWQSAGQGGGIEGSVTFFAVYAKGNPGTPVSEQRLGGERCVSWLSGSIACNPTNSRTGDIQSFSLSAGNYELRSYVRGCNGNCGSQEDAQFECRKPFSINAGQTLYIRRDPTSSGCTLNSTPTRLQVLGAADLSGRILWSSDNVPAAGVRIAAIRRQDVTSTTFPFLGTLTDSTGQYLLQNVPEGEYYLAVVWEKRKTTFFPGVADQTAATLVTVKSRQDLSRIDFSIPDR